jgi:hypothetical protein
MTLVYQLRRRRKPCGTGHDDQVVGVVRIAQSGTHDQEVALVHHRKM